MFSKPLSPFQEPKTNKRVFLIEPEDLPCFELSTLKWLAGALRIKPNSFIAVLLFSYFSQLCNSRKIHIPR